MKIRRLQRANPVVTAYFNDNSLVILILPLVLRLLLLHLLRVAV